MLVSSAQEGNTCEFDELPGHHLPDNSSARQRAYRNSGKQRGSTGQIGNTTEWRSAQPRLPVRLHVVFQHMIASP